MTKQIPSSLKRPLKRAGQATAITMLIAASVHLAVALLSSLVTRKISFINPINFLGLNLIWPRYLDSELATGIAWLFLIGTGITIFLLHGRIKIVFEKLKQTTDTIAIGIMSKQR